MAHWSELLSATNTNTPWLDLLRQPYNEYRTKAYVKLFQKTPQAERTSLIRFETSEYTWRHCFTLPNRSTISDTDRQKTDTVSGGEQVAKHK